MFKLYPHIVYALFMVMLVANALNLVIGRLVLRAFVMVGQLSKPILIPLVLMLATIGAYACRTNPYDLVTLLVCGFLGFGMMVAGIPVLLW